MMTMITIIVHNMVHTSLFCWYGPIKGKNRAMIAVIQLRRQRYPGGASNPPISSASNAAKPIGVRSSR